MANPEHLDILKQEVETWNEWRQANPDTRPDLRRADLNDTDLSRADLSGADLSGALLRRAYVGHANLIKADLTRADLNGALLSGADLSGANLCNALLSGAHFDRAMLTAANLSEATMFGTDLRGAYLTGANLHKVQLTGGRLSGSDLTGATLTEANLTEANLNGADLTGADLTGADLTGVHLTESDLTEANLKEADLTRAVAVRATLTDCDLSSSKVYGISVWDPVGEPRAQRDLAITPWYADAVVTVDDLEIAQFMYLMLNNDKLRNVIDTITSKLVLILGRFTDDRKQVLDALRDELRTRNLTPVLFDFDPSDDQDFTDTVTLLARMARYVIADLTDPRSVQQELSLIAPQVVVAIKPIILAGQEPWSMFDDLRRRSRGLMKPYTYTDLERLLAGLDAYVLQPLAEKREQLKALLDDD